MIDPSWTGMARAELAGQVGDLRQLASVRRIVLDEGSERGVRTLAFSTGGGLDFWVFSDRSFDIGPLWWGGMPIAWQGPDGFASPALMDAERWNGHGFAQGLGGLLVTAGLEHIRQPGDGHPLHGRLPFTPGRLLAYGEDWNHPDGPILFCEGEIVLTQPGGGGYRMRRRIEAPVGGRTLRLHDRIEGLSTEEQPLAMLYHMNFGFPLIGEGTTATLRDGTTVLPTIEAVEADRTFFNCVEANDPSGTARCIVTCPGEAHGPTRRLFVDFDAEAMPWLQIWRDPRPGRRILGIEPATSERLANGTNGPGPTLKPGEEMRFGFDLILDETTSER
ncbi:DUF4432 family protein [Pararhizobium mangrovi]|uniref:DUF4432 family protein n=1 Tax=Pararhizobium mangrovi TaxID=2590452 RepID=A0A506TV74_9HYPH|nr:DUF4432 family protein [Pararhizobium mangrovi]TPW25972.1 DUF4432 family protein [Pararhizobium mangrovi]